MSVLSRATTRKTLAALTGRREPSAANEHGQPEGMAALRDKMLAAGDSSSPRLWTAVRITIFSFRSPVPNQCLSSRVLASSPPQCNNSTHHVPKIRIPTPGRSLRRSSCRGPDCPAPGESALLPMARQTDGAHHFGRTLRRGDEPRLRLPQVSRHARRRRDELHAHLQRRVCRAGRRVQHRAQHAGPGRRPVHLPVGAQRPARVRQWREQVRPHALGRCVLRAARRILSATRRSRASSSS